MKLIIKFFITVENMALGGNKLSVRIIVRGKKQEGSIQKAIK